MHKNIKYTLVLLFSFSLLLGFEACSPAEGNHPGYEYMPDMKHGLAYEANYYDFYSINTWGTEDEYYALAKPKKPVEGTIARGYVSMAGKNAEEIANAEKQYGYSANGSVPYYYEDTEEDRTKATNEITENPFPITEEGLRIGENLYNINCGICHGEKGDGAGYLVRDDGGKYPAQPANFLTDEFIQASPGRYYHSIMYGKNVMGAYKDKLSYRERWEVIHWIRALQAKEKKMEYTPESNTLNSTATPMASIEIIEKVDSSNIKHEMHEDANHMDQDHHGDHGGHGGDQEGH